MATKKYDFGWETILPALKKDRFYITVHPRQPHVPVHDHSFLELTYILRGPVEHTLDGHTETLEAGDFLIVDYGSRHSYTATGNTGFSNWDCLFLPELLDPVLKGTRSLRALLEHYLLHYNPRTLSQDPARMVFHDDDGRVRRLLTRIEEESLNRAAGYTEMIRCHLIEILLLTMRRLEDASSASQGQDISSFVVQYISEHYMEQISLGTLSEKLNYSLPYISKRFKEDLGVSFVRYLQDFRVMQGCRLLSGSNKTLDEITRMVGYKDVKFFSELIKRATGLSPTDFRKAHREHK